MTEQQHRLQNSCQFNAPVQSILAINQYSPTHLFINKPAEKVHLYNDQSISQDEVAGFPTKGAISLWLGNCHESRKVLNDFLNFKLVQKFNTNLELLEWLLKVAEKVTEQDDLSNNISSKINTTNNLPSNKHVINSLQPNKHVVRNAVLNPSKENDDMRRLRVYNLHNCFGKIAEQLNEQENNEEVCVDELIYQRYVKYMNKLNPGQTQSFLKTDASKISKLSNYPQKRKMQNENDLIEDIDFIRVVKQAKVLKEFKFKDMELASLKKLRQYPSKLSKFDFERVKELEKLENTSTFRKSEFLINNSSLIDSIDNNTKELEKLENSSTNTSSAKEIINNNINELEKSEYPSKLSKFDFERVKELEKLENTSTFRKSEFLINNSSLIDSIDNNTKELEKLENSSTNTSSAKEIINNNINELEKSENLPILQNIELLNNDSSLKESINVSKELKEFDSKSAVYQSSHELVMSSSKETLNNLDEVSA